MSDPLHADAVATLRDWSAPDDLQEAHRRRVLAHLAGHPDGMRRACFPDHVTAGTLVLAADGASVLLNLHRKARRWFAFGGHCEAGDATLAGVARREGREESGISRLRLDPVPLQLDVHAVEFCDPRGTVHHLDVRFLSVAPERAAHATSDESLDVRWWPVDALPEELDADMHALVDLARARREGASSGRASSGQSMSVGGSMSEAAE